MYNATVCKIENLRKHSNADRLKLGNACGFQVIVGLDTIEGTLGLFFPTDGRLSTVFATANNLIRITDPDTGAKTGGLFDLNCRVRAQKLRGEISEGFWCELNYLDKVPNLVKSTIEKLKNGDEFTSLDGVEICSKYVTRATKTNTSQKKGTGALKKKNPRFPEHLDTKQFRKDLGQIPEGSVIYLSAKMHGTSGRYAYVLDELPLTRWERLKKRLGFKVKPRLGYQYVVGTRRCELAGKSDSFYGGDFRQGVMKDVWHLLRKGEILYGEIVGWTDTGAPIMPPASTKCLKDKAFTKQYGETMYYKYGCPQGTCKFYIYRIAYTNEDGHLVELSWPQVKKRAGELGLPTVPDLYNPILYSNYMNSILLNSEDFDYIGPECNTPDSKCITFLERLRSLVQELTQGPDPLDSTQIREGVCVRVESQNPLMILKEKSWIFRSLEDGLKSDETIIDIEEQQEFADQEANNVD